MAIDKVLGISGSSITWSYRQIAKMIEKDTLIFTNEVQRSFVWKKERMSELIWSIIMGFPIPPLYAGRDDNEENEKIKRYDCLDGQQRCTTIYKFLNDEFELSTLSPIPFLNENGEESNVDISGKRFSELEEELQDIIKDSTISVKYFDNLEQESKRELFKRLNGGQPLSTKAKTLASSKDIKTLLNIGSHKLFHSMLTEKARQNKNQAVIVVKAWTMLNRNIEDISFASKDFNPMIEEVEISNQEKQELISIFDFVVNVHDELVENKEKDVARKLFTETHLISLMPLLKQAIQNNINESMFGEFLVSFFKTNNDTDVYTAYMEASSNAVARNYSIVSRHNALEKSFNEYFKKG